MKQKKQPKSALHEDAVLVDRHQAARILNVCVGTVRRMQDDGSLTPVRLRAGLSSKTFYAKAEVYSLAGVDA